MITYFFVSLRRGITLAVLFAGTLSSSAIAGGVSLGATRIVFPANASQSSIVVNNSDDNLRFLVNAWVEDRDGKKSTDFNMTPPLSVIGPASEKILGIKFNRPQPLPADRETLYWFNAQAIPQQSATKSENILQLASLSRIKLFVRPVGLQMKAIDAPQNIIFSRNGNQIVVNNPTPYHITLVNLMDGKTVLPNTMVPPKDSVTLQSKSNGSGTITFSTINDYGAITAKQNGVMK